MTIQTLKVSTDNEVINSIKNHDVVLLTGEVITEDGTMIKCEALHVHVVNDDQFSVWSTPAMLDTENNDDFEVKVFDF